MGQSGMARSILSQLLLRNSSFSRCLLTSNTKINSRFISTSDTVLAKAKTDDVDISEGKSDEPTEKPKETTRSWIKNFLQVRTIPASRESHSSQLSDKETVYEMQFHAVKPEFMEDYLVQFEIFQQLMHDKKTGASLVGSFTVEIGDQDEAVHLWAYKGGYPVLNNATEIYRTDRDFIEFRKNRNKMLRSRRNQILLSFSFWPEPVPRDGKNIYEMRSYTLKANLNSVAKYGDQTKQLDTPGTMIEWGNNWASGIQSRMENDEPVCGLFSAIGDLTRVEHIWGYKDLQSRDETRRLAWSKPGWDKCVEYTVPLIRHMQSRILIPTPFSPLQ